MSVLKEVKHYPDTNSVEATWVDADDKQVRCHSYADVQMDMLRADLGADADQYEELIATVEAGIVPPPPKPVEILQAEIVASTQGRLDVFARTRNYDGILSACTYATSTVPKFAAEGQYCVTARDATWAALYQFMADVQGGTRPMPEGYADVEPLLPTLAWPE